MTIADCLLARLKGVRPSGPNKWSALCPAHNDSHPSLSVRLASSGYLLVKCHVLCRTADVMAAVGLTLSALFPESRTTRTNRSPEYTPRQLTNSPLHQVWGQRAEYIWNKSIQLRGSLVEVYLRCRGCQLPPEDGDLRFLPAQGTYPAAMLARVTDAVTGQPISLHFTRLAADGQSKAGTDRDKSWLRGHRLSCGVIRLWPDDAVHGGLAVGEGIETMLAAAHVFSPVWACGDASHLAAFPVLSGIECLTVFADHDDAGLKAANAGAQRWADVGREVYIRKSNQPGLDCADLVAA